MTRRELAEKLRRETDGVHASPALMQRTLRAAQGKEENQPVMMKKMTLAVAFALIAVTLCAAAIAAANRWGILDFVDRYAVDHYIPEDAQDYVQTDVAALEDDWVTVGIRELYYDGRTARMAVEVTPKQAHTLLLGTDALLSDAIGWMRGAEDDMRTVYQVIQEEGYEHVLSANCTLGFAEPSETCIGGTEEDPVPYSGVSACMMDYILREDDTLTFYLQVEFDADCEQRDVTFRALISPYAMPLTPESQPDYEQRSTMETNLTLTASVSPTDEPAGEGAIPNVYVNREPVEFPEVGVRIDRLTIEVKPQDIYAIIDYTVTDADAFAKIDGGLWFEFIDPEKTGEPYAQRLTSGLSGGGMVSPIDDDGDEPTKYRQTETLGRNELHDSYTLRAFNCWDKTRYETHTASMQPAAAEDMKADE